MNDKVTLKCTRTHGRWNKNDVASFDPETAKTLTGGKKPAWVQGEPDAADEADDGKDGKDGSGGAAKKAAPTA